MKPELTEAQANVLSIYWHIQQGEKNGTCDGCRKPCVKPTDDRFDGLAQCYECFEASVFNFARWIKRRSA